MTFGPCSVRAPRAAILDRQWTAGVPAQWPAVGEYLREQTGHDFPILALVNHARPRRALAAILRDNLAERDASLGLQAKTLAGLVYATVVQDTELAAEAGRLAENSGVPEATVGAVTDFASEPETFDTDSDIAASQAALRSNRHIDDVRADALLLAEACPPSMAQVTPAVVAGLARNCRRRRSSSCCTGSAPTWPAQAEFLAG